MRIRQLAWLLLAAVPAGAQGGGGGALLPNAFPAPMPEIQFLNNAGQPLAGGKLCTYQSNTTNLLATYTDSTAGTSNSNPVVLDAAGRASVWLGLNSGLYTFTLLTGGDGTCNTGTALWTQNNLGLVNPGILPALYIQQTSSGASGRGGYIDLPPITYPNQTCFDVYGNPVNQPLSALGYPSFGPNDVIIWDSESPLPGVGGCATAFVPNETFGLNVNTYIFAMGGFTTLLSAYNAVDAAPCGSDASCALGPAGQQGGGVHGLSGDFNNYVNVGHYSGVPPLTTFSGFHNGALYADDVALCLEYFNGTTWTCLGSGGGGGGAVGPASAIQRTNGTGTFVGDANLTFASQVLVVTGTAPTAIAANISGYVQTTGGFETTSTAANAIQATAGGVYASLHSWLEIAAPSLSSAGQAVIYADSTAHTLMVSENGGAYSSFGGSGTVSSSVASRVAFYTGATSVGGNANFTFTTIGGNPLLTVTAGSASVAGMAVATGFIQSDSGFLATTGTCVEYNCIQAATGGVKALNLDAINYTKVGTSAGAPAATAGETSILGAIYFDTSGVFKGCIAATGTTCTSYATFAAGSAVAFGSITSGTNSTASMTVGTGAFISFSGSGIVNANEFNSGLAPGAGSLWKSAPSTLAPIAAAYTDVVNLWTGGGCSGSNVLTASGSCIAPGGGVTSINSISGAITLVGTSSQVIITGGPGFTFSLPQSIATTSNVTFNSVTATILDATSGIQISGVNAINSSNQFVGTAVNVTGVVQSQVTGCGSGNPAFQTSNTKFSVDGCGNLSLIGTVTATILDATSGIQISGANAINSSNQFVGTAVNVTGVVQSQVTGCGSGNPAFQTSNTKFSVDGCGNLSMIGAGTFDGGIIIPVTANSVISIGTGGNFYDRPLGAASGGVSCSGISDGWMAISSDDYVVVCLGGSRFRAALASY